MPLLSNVSRETAAKLEAFAAMVVDENARQNLVAQSTLADVQGRHVDDSLQLIDHAPLTGKWLDIGSGAGFPGMVVAIARPREETLLVEPRTLRAAFLTRVADTLKLTNVQVITARVEAVKPLDVSVISARAVAALSKLLTIGAPHAAPDCVWLLSKGRTAAAELAEVRKIWQGDFDLIPSQTDAEAAIVKARDVQLIRRKSHR